MRPLRCIADVLRARLCVSCGACTAVSNPPRLRLAHDPRLHYATPTGDRAVLHEPHSPEFGVCPAPGMALDALSRTAFGDRPSSLELGRFRLAVVARATDPAIARNAASGGAMTAIAWHLINTGTVDAALVTRFAYGGTGPHPVAFVAHSLADLRAAQGSKYCPTSPNQRIAQCRASGLRHLFVGTPCQVAALRLAIAREPALARTFPVTMGSFCGGFRDDRLVAALLARHHIPPGAVREFRFRGGGRPGGLRIEDASGRVAGEPYPDYARGLHFAKLKRCIFCIDGTAELADFACGDAWLPRYQTAPDTWSIVLARSDLAVRHVETMRGSGSLVCEPVSVDDIIRSQRSNLASKKHRQRKRMNLCRLMGARLPAWDVELPLGGSYLEEARVLVSKWLSDHGLRDRDRAGL